jgi:predicted acylesterase/phospholipase RssA
MKIALVLTGGSLRGIVAQTAALQVLEDNKLDIKDIVGICGTSAGSLTGAFYASCVEPATMAELFSNMKKSDYIDPSYWRIVTSALLMGRGLTGMLEGKALLKWLKANLPRTHIEDTCMPLAINVTNISKQIPEVRTTGPLAETVRASTSIPFVYKPQQIGDDYFVDGGAVNNIPLDEAAKLFPSAEAFIIITTFGIKNTEDPSDNSWIRKPLAPLFILSRTLHAISRELYSDNLNAGGKPVAVLSIDPGPIDLQQIEKFMDAYKLGLEDARKKVPGVLKQIGYTS